MYVKLPPKDLNLGPYPPHPTNIYTCGVTIAPRVRGDCDFQTLRNFVFTPSTIYLIFCHNYSMR